MGSKRTAGGPFYELGAVARATGATPALLHSWCVQDILVPAVEAKGRGSRRYFDRAAVLRAAILVELRRLFGIRLRLGEFGRWAATLDPVLIDRRRDTSQMYLLACRVGAALTESYVPVVEGPQALIHKLQQHRIAVVLDLTAINTRVWTALEG